MGTAPPPVTPYMKTATVRARNRSDTTSINQPLDCGAIFLPSCETSLENRIGFFQFMNVSD